MADKPYWKYFAFLVALTATSGSLYLSEVMGLVPCELCWFQRITMYPLVLVIGVSLYLGDRIDMYVLPLSVTGFVISTYHNYLQMTPAEGTCKTTVPCTEVLYQWNGLSIPMMSLIAFGLTNAAFFYPYLKGERSFRF